MDNIAHALTGAALGETGLKRLTGLGMPALVLGANLADLDVLGVLAGEGLAWRRGWTHGPLALVTLPAALAVALMAFDRWQTRRGTRPAARVPVNLKPLVLLTFIGALSHLLLDFLNTWGIRLLMPFSERWFYGDALFIVDPWIWLALGLGVWFSRRGAFAGAGLMRRPATRALLGVAVYSSAMYAAGRGAEYVVDREFRASGLGEPEHVLASPVPADPFRREIFVQTADGYRFGDFRWTPWPRLTMDSEVVPTHMRDPAIARAAAEHKRIADFLYWSRYPFANIQKTDCGTRVTINDGRYSRRPDSGLLGASVLLVDAGAMSGVTSPAGCGDSSGGASGGMGGARND